MTDELLIKYIKRETSLLQTREVIKWIEESPINKRHFIQLQVLHTGIAMETAVTYDKKEIEKNLRTIRRSNTGRKIFRAAAVAASVILLATLFTVRYSLQQPAYESLLVDNSHGNKILLMIDDEAVEIADTAAVINYQTGGNIRINDTLTYNTQTTALNRIFVPYGKRAQLLLADGSSVYLNSGASLVFPAVFTGKKREVFLDGEGFFHIRKDSDGRKFSVKTIYKTIEVSGTVFNVSVDKEQETFETVLVSGAISVNAESGSLTMQPCQYYGYSAGEEREEIKQVELIYYTSWVYGKLHFHREPVRNILRKLEKHYHVEIELHNKLFLDYTITGNLNLDETVEKTMNVVMSLLIPDYNKQPQTAYKINPLY